jgi:acyl dehydratase
VTAATVLDGLDAVRAAAGTHLGWSDWIEIDQERVDRFGAATGGPATADGWLTLSLTNLFMPQIVEVRGVSLGVNYGTDQVRFPSPVPVGSRIRGGGELVEVSPVGEGLQTRIRITVEIEGSDDPACVVDALSRWVP